MNPNQYLCLVAFLCLPLCGPSQATELSTDTDVRFLERTFTTLPAAMVRQPFKIKVRNSPRLSVLIRQSPRVQGYEVREDDEGAAVSFELLGAYGIQYSTTMVIDHVLAATLERALKPFASNTPISIQ